MGVETICEPGNDAIAVRVKSPLLKTQRLAIQIHFPYGTGETVTADWNHPDAHETILVQPEPNRAEFTRKLDNDVYFAAANWTKGATLTNTARHQFEIVPDTKSEVLELVCAFSPKDIKDTAPPVDSRKSNRPRRRTGTIFGRQAGRLIYLAAKIPAGLNSNAALSCPSTSPPSRTRAKIRRRRPASPTIRGRASSISKCIFGTRRTSRCGIVCPCWKTA